MLIVFGGLPGTGKTTIARQVAALRRAAYLRIDSMEHALRSTAPFAGSIGAAGYVVANAVAADNLALGLAVVVDCVNPVRESRQGWRDTAVRTGCPLVEIEVACSDPDEHRRRIETRTADIPGLALPTWQDVLEREYQPWQEPHLVIDTAGTSIREAVARVQRHLDARPHGAPDGRPG